MTTTTREVKLPGTPKPWVNRTLMVMLRTPGVRRLLGKAFAIISVTGATTGRTYTTPVQYVRIDGQQVVLSQRHRKWWRNLRSVPAAKLEVAGRTLHGTATVAEGDEARAPIAAVLRAVPKVAKFYSVAVDDDGEPDPAGVEALAERLVAITFTAS